MINQTPATITIHQHTPIGVRLKSARESLGMDRKEVAAQLRLHEQMIIMIENGEFKTDLPLTFIRGYVRSYSKLMGLPEKELNEALEFLKPKPDIEESEHAAVPATSEVTAAGPAAVARRYLPVNISNYYMQLVTYLLAVTLIGLVGIWWHTHKSELPDNMDMASQSAAPAKGSSEGSSARNSNTTLQDTVERKTDTTAFPNAENPDSQIPPNAVNTAAAEAAAIPASAETKPAAQTQVAANPSPKASPIRWVTSLIFLLIIITVSMRMYGLSPAMSGAQINKIGRLLKLTGKFKINKTLSLTILATVVILIAGLGITWRYMNTNTHTALKTPPAAPPKQEPVRIPLEAALETLAPSPNVNAVLMAHFRTFALQTMVKQLDDYLSQADAAKFALTDKSTPIGQFIPYKKKSRKYHRTYHPDDNADVNNNNDGNSTPPYYYQTYGVTGQ